MHNFDQYYGCQRGGTHCTCTLEPFAQAGPSNLLITTSRAGHFRPAQDTLYADLCY